jgi:hypothetical protein
MMIRRVMALVVTLTLVVVSCGDDATAPLSESEQRIVNALAADLDKDTGNPIVAGGGSSCFAEGMVRDLGVARLAAIGITAESTDPADALANVTAAEVDVILDIAFRCVDFPALFADDMADQWGVSHATVECIAAALDDAGFFRDLMRQGMIAELIGQGPLLDEAAIMAQYGVVMMEAVVGCATPEELADFMG